MEKSEKPAVLAIPEVIQYCQISRLVDNGLQSCAIELDIPQQDKSARSLAKFFTDGITIDMAGVRFIVVGAEPLGKLGRFTLNAAGVVDDKRWNALVLELEHRSICVDFARLGG